MNVKFILKKLAEINNKANIDHRHQELESDVMILKSRIKELEEAMEKVLFFEEIRKRG